MPNLFDQDEELNTIYSGPAEDEQLNAIWDQDHSSDSQQVKNIYAQGTADLMKAAYPESDYSSNFQAASNSVDPEGSSYDAMKAAIDKIHKDVVGQFDNYYKENGISDPEEALATAETLKKQQDENAKLASDSFGPEKVQTALDKVPDSTPRQEKQAIVDAAAQKDLAKIYSEMGWDDTAIELGKLLVPGITNYRLSKLFGDYFGQDVFSAQRKLGGMQRAWRNLPPERQAALRPALIKYVREAMGDSAGLGVLQNFFTPEGPSQNDEYNPLMNALDIADFVGTAAGATIGIAGGLSKLNRIRRLGELGNVKKAGDESTKVLLDANKETEVGIDQTTAAGNADPTDLSAKMDASVAEGASPQMQKRIADIRRDVIGSFERMQEDVPMIGGFSKQDVNRAIKTREDRLSEELTSEPQFEVNNIKTNRLEDGSFQISGELYNNKTGEKSPFKSKKWNLTLDDNGEYHTVLSNALRNDWLNSPKYLLAGNERAAEDFNKGLWAENLSQALRRDLSDLAIRANKLIKGNPVTKGKKREQVNILLRKGDSHREGGKEVGKVYSYSELKQEGFTDDQIEYYYAQREIFDQMGFLHDKMLRDQIGRASCRERVSR